MAQSPANLNQNPVIAGMLRADAAPSSGAANVTEASNGDRPRSAPEAPRPHDRLLQTPPLARPTYRHVTGRALSEQRQVVCVGRSTRRPKRRLGREGAPLGQRGGAPLFVNLAGDEMALLIEMVVDLGMN